MNRYATVPTIMGRGLRIMKDSHQVGCINVCKLNHQANARYWPYSAAHILRKSAERPRRCTVLVRPYRSRSPAAQASTSFANRELRVAAFLALHTQCSTTFW